MVEAIPLPGEGRPLEEWRVWGTDVLAAQAGDKPSHRAPLNAHWGQLEDGSFKGEVPPAVTERQLNEQVGQVQSLSGQLTDAYGVRGTDWELVSSSRIPDERDAARRAHEGKRGVIVISPSAAERHARANAPVLTTRQDSDDIATLQADDSGEIIDKFTGEQ